MKVNYDDEVDTLYIQFNDIKPDTTADNAELVRWPSKKYWELQELTL